MSGTNHKTPLLYNGPTPVVILVRPQMGENIGAAARAMWNFGLERLRLVAPRDGWPNDRAIAMSSGAAHVIDHVRLSNTVSESLEDLDYVYATTARSRDLTKLVMTPEAAMQDAHHRIANGQKVGVLFGPERAGLENDEIARSNAIISVPVNPAYASLNLAQCVLLTSYEWGRQSIEQAPQEMEMAGAKPANHKEIDIYIERLVAALEPANFFCPESKKDRMIVNLRNMMNRLELTDADIRTFHGILRSLKGPEK